MPASTLETAFRRRPRLSLAGWLTVACLAAIPPVLLPREAEAAPAAKVVDRDGIVKVRSAYDHGQTVERLKKDVESKGIRFFDLVEQSKLAAAAGVELRPSSLLIFGNPALGSLFITANPLAGLDWPVRVLVYTDTKGQVWAAYTDFDYIARRHHIKATEPFKKATGVITSIMSSIAAAPVSAR